jgi:hypothetical protein
MTTAGTVVAVRLTQPFAVNWAIRGNARDWERANTIVARDREKGIMRSIARTFGNHNDELGSSIASHRHLCDDQPANPSNTSLSVDSRER